MTDEARWTRLMHALGFPSSTREWEALHNAWSARGRTYHNLTHLADCLALLDAHRAHAERPDEIELALWFHDAIYRPLSARNELLCARWAQRFLTYEGAARDLTDRVVHMILATRHREPPEFPDEALLLDIDLAVLGSSAEEFERYEHAIRSEYRMVPDGLYKRKRAEILMVFLKREPLYHTPALRSEREQNAKRNLAVAIARLVPS